METYVSKAYEIAAYLPWYFYVGCLILLIFFNRNVKLWTYEARLFGDDKDRILGKLHLKKYKKSYPQVEINVGPLNVFAGKTVEFLINGKLMAKIMVSTEVQAIRQVVPESGKDIIIRPKDIKLNKLKFVALPYFVPRDNDKVSIRVGNIIAYEGILFH